jgi:hypothetical protein
MSDRVTVASANLIGKIELSNSPDLGFTDKLLYLAFVLAPWTRSGAYLFAKFRVGRATERPIYGMHAT